METTGTITFLTPSAVALWVNELCGQFSDGMWENTRPMDHWRFWCGLDVKVGPVSGIQSDSRWMCKKTAYNIAALIPHVGDRMLSSGRMGKALGDACSTRDELRAAEYMPLTLQEWRACKATGEWKYDFCKRYMDTISLPVAEKFYATTYSMQEMRADITHIKAVMKTLKLA